MLGWLRTIVDWIFGRPSSLVQLSLQAPNTSGASRNRWEGPDPPKRPYDPASPARSPRRYGPTGRSASVAVAEPVEDESLVLVGGPLRVSGKPTEPANHQMEPTRPLQISVSCGDGDAVSANHTKAKT